MNANRAGALCSSVFCRVTDSDGGVGQERGPQGKTAGRAARDRLVLHCEAEQRNISPLRTVIAAT